MATSGLLSSSCHGVMEHAMPAEKRRQQWAHTRLSQVERLITDKIRDDLGLLSADEAHDAIADCGSACGAYLASVCAGDHTASASCWAILLAQSVAARRPGGWTVDSADAQAAWDARKIHAHLDEYRGEGFHDSWSEGSATLGGPRAPCVHTSSGKRRLRLDSLGDDKALRAKAASLHRLLLKAGRPGLADGVLNLEPPALRTLSTPHEARRRFEQAVAARWACRAQMKTARKLAAKAAVALPAAPLPVPPLPAAPLPVPPLLKARATITTTMPVHPTAVDAAAEHVEAKDVGEAAVALMGAGLVPPTGVTATGAAIITGLPTAATCMNLLKLPPYESFDILKERLTYAIEAGCGFELS